MTEKSLLNNRLEVRRRIGKCDGARVVASIGIKREKRSGAVSRPFHYAVVADAGGVHIGMSTDVGDVSSGNVRADQRPDARAKPNRLGGKVERIRKRLKRGDGIGIDA